MPCTCPSTYSAEDQATLDASGEMGKAYLTMRLKQWRGGGEPACVFDIDETLIQSTCQICGKQIPPKAIPAIVNLAKFARDKGCAIYIVTARSGVHNTYSANQLKRFGIDFFEEIFGRNDESDNRDMGKMKRLARDVIGQTKTILLNVGDQKTDLEGKGELPLKLPNRMYVV